MDFRLAVQIFLNANRTKLFKQQDLYYTREWVEKITKRKEALPVFGQIAGDWKILPEPRALDVMGAYANPVRRAILRLLALGPMRKSELATYIRRLGKKYSRSLVQYHLKRLEDAGLIGYVADPNVSKKAKLAYRSARIRVQLRPEPAPRGAPRIPEDLIEAELKESKRGER